MNLTKLSIKRPVSVCITVLALVVFGLSSLMGSPIELMPDMEMPYLMIMTTYPGAGPEEVEDLVTSDIESSVSTLSGLKNIRSVSQENVSMVLLEMDYGTNMDLAHMDLQEKINMFSNSLPDEASDPIIMEMSMDMMPSISLSAKPTGDVNLLSLIDDQVVPELEKLSGTASVNVSGGLEDYVSVRLDDQKMQQYHLDMNTVISVIGASDFSIPVGSVDRGDTTLTLRGGVDYNTVQSLREIPFTLPSGSVVHLSDFATVFQTTKEPTSISRYNGSDTVVINVTKRQSASTVDVCRDVVKAMNEINSRNLGVELGIISDTSENIISSVSSVGQTLVMGVILSMVVLFLFFGDWRASVIVGVSMPVSLLVTLILMNMMGLSLNVVSLGGLVIGVGMMVDNSIVVLESIFSSKDQNRSLKEAAVHGADIVTSSVIAGTITTIVVFLPISLLKGMSGQIFKQLGYTVIFSLTASLISALTLVPLMFVRMKPIEKKETWINHFLAKASNVYGRILEKTFRHKVLTVIVSFVLLVVSVMMFPMVNVEMMPSTDEGTIAIDVETKPGLTLEKTEEIMTQLEQLVSQHPDVEDYSLSAGGGGSITVYLKDDRKMSTTEVVDQWREEIPALPNCNISISSSNTTDQMTGGSDIAINLQGNDLDVLKEASKQVEDLMRRTPGILRVSSSLTSGAPQAEIKVDPLKAHAVGYTPQQVVGIVYSMISGKEATTIRQNGQEYSVFVEYPADQYETISDLSGLVLTAPSGQQVPLLDIATVEYSNAPQEIGKENSQYLVTITGQPSSSAKYTASTEITSEMANLNLPAGVSMARGGSQEQMITEFKALGGAIATAIFLVFMVMAMQFESPRFSGLVMLCIPFSLIGSLGLLLITRCTLSMPSLIGFLMLVGTVVNSGILFIDTANRYRETMDAEEALILAGKSRLRPILMTTLTTVLSMVPMGMGYGDNGELMQGMAVVMIGGLVASTILTLVLLPTFYLLVNKKPKQKKQKKRHKNKGHQEPAEDASDLNNNQLEEAIDHLDLPSPTV